MLSLPSLPLFPTQYTSQPERFSAMNPSTSVYITSSIANVSLNTITQLSSFRNFNISTFGIGTEGSYNASAASLSFNQLPACTESWRSRLAASNGTVMTTITEVITVSPSVSETVYVPGGSAGITVIGPTTETFTIATLTNRLSDDDVCCGDCNILYPDVVVYYWPVRKNNNTWCLQYLKNSSPPAFISTMGAPSLPKLPPQNPDPNSGPRVGFGAHLPARAVPAVISQAASPRAPSQSLQPRTFVPLNESKVYAVVDGSTLYDIVAC